LVAAAILIAAEDVRRVAIYDELVTIEIPATWEEESPLDLEQTTFRTAEATGGQLVEVYQHGFRPSHPTTEPGLPEVLIQIRESGRIRSGDLVGDTSLKFLRQGAEARYHGELAPLIMAIEVLDSYFDADTNTLHLEHRIELRLKGEVRVLTVAFLTERGLLTFHFFDRAARIADSRQVFDQMIQSVQIDPTLAYRPRWSDRWPGLPFFIASGVAALVLLIIIIRRRRESS
jgi:hypothetical protein